MEGILEIFGLIGAYIVNMSLRRLEGFWIFAREGMGVEGC